MLLGCDTSKMAAEPKPAGVVGERVAANLRRLRRGTSTYELSRLLAEIGWEIRANGLTRIENGSRRVDVDDLVALSVALDCSPNRLLMPPMTRDDPPGTARASLLVGDIAVTVRDMWVWATGERPLARLQRMPDGALLPGRRPSGQEVAAFAVENQPHHFADVEDVEDAEGIVSAIGGALAVAHSRGVPMSKIRATIDQALEDVEAADDGEG